MRIFYASDSTPNALLQSNLWRNNLYQPLVDLGHEVVEFAVDWRETFKNLDPSDPKQGRYIASNRPRLSKELWNQVSAAHAEKPIDLFFSYFYDACVTPETIDRIRALGITTANWYCNASYQLHLVANIAPHYDWCLVPEKFRLKDYTALGAHPLYFQEAANPDIYKPYNLPKDYDVSFVGQAYGERPGYIKYLVDHNLPIKVFGYGWQNYAPDRSMQSTKDRRGEQLRLIASQLRTKQGWQAVGRRLARVGKMPTAAATLLPSVTSLPASVLGGTLSDGEMVQMFSRSKINLGFSSVGDTHARGERIVQIRLRDFEVPMSGGFYLVERMEELDEFFLPNQEIACYEGPDDLVEKITYYLAHDEERERIRLAGFKRATSEHTWHQRFRNAFRAMNLPTT